MLTVATRQVVKQLAFLASGFHWFTISAETYLITVFCFFWAHDKLPHDLRDSMRAEYYHDWRAPQAMPFLSRS